MKDFCFLYIDSSDILHSIGSGGASMFASAVRIMGNKFRFICSASKKYFRLGNWHKIEQFGNTIQFLPVCDSDFLKKIPHGFRNIYFALCVLCKIKTINSICSLRFVLTRMTFILWLCAYLTKEKHICYYAPGLRYTDFPNRHRLIGMIIMPLFKLIHANALNRARIILAAASRDEINRFKVEMRQYGFRKDIIYYPTAVNTQLFFPRDKVKMRQKYNLPMNKPIFIFVGRLAKVKGIDFLIDSTLLFKNKYGDCQLLIVGDGEQYDYLNNYVVKKGLQEDVLFLGNCTSERVAEYIGASDIFVVGSYYEGFSVAMVEAVVSGRPIVSTEVSGAKDLIKFGVNGYIVSERNPTLFVESMKKALFLEEEAINYSKLYSNKYDERNFWEMLIEQCIGQY